MLCGVCLCVLCAVCVLCWWLCCALCVACRVSCVVCCVVCDSCCVVCAVCCVCSVCVHVYVHAWKTSSTIAWKTSSMMSWKTTSMMLPDHARYMRKASQRPYAETFLRPATTSNGSSHQRHGCSLNASTVEHEISISHFRVRGCTPRWENL